ncbi:hypothetical protein E2C01_049626 [Portunus trituberculatus]|uniref:Uncharacterized protein n=1 Tax=Portunus trituberculatus TaxID=210409 RepID=A0A5B7G9Z1_PORTR|nr:hypothetical protein [Portunus trituberculatus]
MVQACTGVAPSRVQAHLRHQQNNCCGRHSFTQNNCCSHYSLTAHTDTTATTGTAVAPPTHTTHHLKTSFWKLNFNFIRRARSVNLGRRERLRLTHQWELISISLRPPPHTEQHVPMYQTKEFGPHNTETCNSKQ